MTSNLLKPFDETSEITLSITMSNHDTGSETKLESIELMDTDGQPISYKDENKSKYKIENG